MTDEFNLLVKMEPSRKRPKPGDVFVIQPKEGLYYYGKVIRKVESSDLMMDGSNLVFIYNHSTRWIDLPDSLDVSELLIAPVTVNNQGWLRGYFQTIGSLKVTEEEAELDFGFWDVVFRKFLDESGNELHRTPKIYGTFGLGSFGSVGYKIDKALGFNRAE